MTTLIDFLSVEDVEQLHREQLGMFGGRDGVRDRNTLEAAVATPEATFGNKRTGLNAALVLAAAERA